MWRHRGIETRRSAPEISDEMVFTETLHVIKNLYEGLSREEKLTCRYWLGPSKSGQEKVLVNLGRSLSDSDQR